MGSKSMYVMAGRLEMSLHSNSRVTHRAAGDRLHTHTRTSLTRVRDGWTVVAGWNVSASQPPGRQQNSQRQSQQTTATPDSHNFYTLGADCLLRRVDVTYKACFSKRCATDSLIGIINETSAINDVIPIRGAQKSLHMVVQIYSTVSNRF